jgi:hypothetical protein
MCTRARRSSCALPVLHVLLFYSCSSHHEQPRDFKIVVQGTDTRRSTHTHGVRRLMGNSGKRRRRGRRRQTRQDGRQRKWHVTQVRHMCSPRSLKEHTRSVMTPQHRSLCQSSGSFSFLARMMMTGKPQDVSSTPLRQFCQKMSRNAMRMNRNDGKVL